MVSTLGVSVFGLAVSEAAGTEIPFVLLELELSVHPLNNKTAATKTIVNMISVFMYSPTTFVIREPSKII